MSLRLSRTGPHDCRWIDGNVNRDPLCCGEKTHKQSSWCKAHFKIAYPHNRAQAKALVELFAKNQGFPRRG